MSLRISGLLSGKKELDREDPVPRQRSTTESFEPQALVVLVIDGSGSMRPSMSLLNQCVQYLVLEFRKDPNLSMTVQLAVVLVRTNPELVQPFALAKSIELQDYQCGGLTALHGGVLLGLSACEAERKACHKKGVDTRQPMLVVITDGAATDAELKDAASQALREGKNAAQQSDQLLPYFFAVKGADIEALQELSGDDVYELTRENLLAVFQWLRVSLKRHSMSQIGEVPQLPCPSQFGLFKANG